MSAVAGPSRLLKPGSRRGTAQPAATDRDSKPKPGKDYERWLERTWQGDARELRKGRYLHQQADLRREFEASDYWREVSTRLREWAARYAKENEAPLFSGQPALPTLASKPWQSFLSRTWRANVGRNKNWPEEPQGGWWMPDTWFEQAWDIVRTRIVVRYMDGVEILAAELRRCAEEFGLEARVDPEAKRDGYYAFHVYIPQRFQVAALDYEGTQERSSEIEVQVMTEMAAVISELTHTYYEMRREDEQGTVPPLWADTGEWLANALHHQSADLEKRVLELRDEIRKRTTTAASPHGE
jgi:hypothetical protein